MNETKKQQRRNLRHVIRLMEKVEKSTARLYMPAFHEGALKKNMRTAMDCGTQACISGWCAYSPYILKQGYVQSPSGALASANKVVSDGSLFSELFGISHKEASDLIFPLEEEYETKYQVERSGQITGAHVIARLQGYLAEKPARTTS